MRHFGTLVTALVLAPALLLAGCCMKPKAKKGFNEPCSNPLDCESMKCNVERGGVCTKDCHTDADCGSGLVCAGDPTGTGASCAVKKGNPTGAKCQSRDECDHGSCLHKGEDETGFCSQRCQSANDCPAGFKICERISDLGAQKVCLPGEVGGTPPKVGVRKPAGGTPAGGATTAAPGGRPPPPAKK